MNIEVTYKFKIGQTDIICTEKEAKELYNELHRKFGTIQQYIDPYKIPPIWDPNKTVYSQYTVNTSSIDNLGAVSGTISK